MRRQYHSGCFQQDKFNVGASVLARAAASVARTLAPTFDFYWTVTATLAVWDRAGDVLVAVTVML
jgi:hypothetical protein